MIAYAPQEEVPNENDVAKAELMYKIVDEVQVSEKPPRALAEFDTEGEFAAAGISYVLTPPDYKLCGTFEQDTRNTYEGDDGENRVGGVNFYKHSRGQHCFTVSTEAEQQ